MFLQPSKSSTTKQQPYCLESHPAKRWAGEGHQKQTETEGFFLDRVIFLGLERYVGRFPPKAEACRSKISWSFQPCLSIWCTSQTEFDAGLVEQIHRRPMKIPGPEIQSKISARNEDNEGPGR